MADKTIWKFTLPITDRFAVPMPAGAQILSVQSQFDMPQMWAVVDPMAPMEERWFEMRGTGHRLGNVGAFIGTFQTDGGGYVFHLFHRKEAP